MQSQATIIHIHQSLHVASYAFIVVSYTFWVAAGIPWILDLDMFSMEQDTVIFNISVVGVMLSMILLMLYVIRSQLDYRTNVMAGITLSSVLLALGLLISYFSTGVLYYVIGEQKGYRVLIVNPPMLFLEVLSNLSFAMAYFLAFYRIRESYSDFLTRKEQARLRASVISLILALVITILSSILFRLSHITTAKLFGGIGRLFALVAIILFSHILVFDPISIATLKWNPVRLKNRGIIGWVLVSLSDLGVNIIHSSPEWKEYYNITYEDLIRFGGSGLTVIGIGDIFADALFFIPFPKKGCRLFSLNISFPLIDPYLKDERLNKTTKAIFSIIMPLDALPLTKKINKWERKARSLLRQITTINELEDTNRMEHLVFYLLRSLF